MKKFFLSTISIAVLFGILFTATQYLNKDNTKNKINSKTQNITGSKEQNQKQNGQSDSIKLASVSSGGTSYSVKLYDDINKLTNKAQVVFIGQVIGDKGTWNLARDIKDIKKEDTKVILPGTDYSIKVEQYLKGTGPNEILLTKTGGEYKGQKLDFIPLEVGQKYIVFAEFSQDFGRYKGFGEPWIFKIRNGEIEVDSEAKGLSKIFPKEKEQDFIDKVKKVKN